MVAWTGFRAWVAATLQMARHFTFVFTGQWWLTFVRTLRHGFSFQGGYPPFCRQQMPWPWGASAPRRCGLALADSGSEVSRVFWVRIYPPDIRSSQCVLRQQSGPPPLFSP